MSLRILSYLIVLVTVIILVPALVVGGAITFTFALPLLALLVVGLIVLKVVYDIKLSREFGRYSGANARDLLDADMNQSSGRGNSGRQGSTNNNDNQRKRGR